MIDQETKDMIKYHLANVAADSTLIDDDLYEMVGELNHTYYVSLSLLTKEALDYITELESYIKRAVPVLVDYNISCFSDHNKQESKHYAGVLVDEAQSIISNEGEE